MVSQHEIIFYNENNNIQLAYNDKLIISFLHFIQE